MRQHPQWLKKPLAINDDFYATRKALREYGVNTVCESSRCPNMAECFSRSFATFLILGRRCTRGCLYCAAERSEPVRPDPAEPERIAGAAARLGLNYAVITSVTRDDLPDGGASQFVRAAEALRAARPGIKIEFLIPDFNGNPDSIRAIANCGVQVVGHNIEMVRRLFPTHRRGADYDRSLQVLRRVKELDPRQPTKSGIMVGFGERFDEVLETMEDLKATGCDMLTIGQYLCPDTLVNVSVADFVTPEIFRAYRLHGARMGFRHVSAGPFVRSSYMADMLYDKREEEDHHGCHVAAAC